MEGGRPWGFKIAGGAEVNKPIVITKVSFFQWRALPVLSNPVDFTNQCFRQSLLGLTSIWPQIFEPKATFKKDSRSIMQTLHISSHYCEIRNFTTRGTRGERDYDDLIAFWIVVIRIVEMWFRLIQMAKEQSSEYKKVIWLLG